MGFTGIKVTGDTMQGGISATLMLFLPPQWVAPCLLAGPSKKLA